VNSIVVSHCFWRPSPLFRYARHVLSWYKSRTAQRLLQFVVLSASWSFAVSVFAREFTQVASFLKKSSLSSGALGTFLAPLALLLTVRTNSALARLNEARGAWGRAVLASRSLMSMCATHIMPLNRERALLIGRYLVCFGWSFKGMLRGEDDRDVIKQALPKNEADWMMKQNTKRPLAATARIRKLVADLSSPNKRSDALPPTIQMQMEERIYDLETCVGICERIFGSPIPPTYTRHTSRVLSLFLALLPLGLVGLGLPPASLVASTSLITYVLVGIDEIGVEIEHPFPLLPMQQLAFALQRDVCAQVGMLDTMPSD